MGNLRLSRWMGTAALLCGGVWLGTGCGAEEYEAQMREMAAAFEGAASFVDYEDEGRIFLVDNHCEVWPDDALDPAPPSWDCPTPWDGRPVHGAVEGCPLTYMPSVTDEHDRLAFGEPNCGVREIDTMAEAQELLHIHRWVDVNPSLTSIEAAQVVSWSKLINRYGFHEEGDPVNALLLVYLPMGPEYERVDWDSDDEDKVDQQRFEEVLRTVCGKHPVEHPTFESRLHELIDGATVATDDAIVVTSSSYAGHQVMNVVRDKQNVFWYDINPTFGLFSAEGSMDYEGLCAMGSCDESPIDGYTTRHSCDPNPMVFDWIYDLEYSTVTQCLLTSRGDCLSQYEFGVGLAFTDGDPAEDLTHENTCGYPENPEHDWIYSVDDDAGIMGPAVWSDPNRTDDLVIDLETSEAWVGPGGTSKLWYSGARFATEDTPMGDVRRYDKELEWAYWAPERTHNALWANLHDRPGATKVQLVHAAGAGDECSDTDNTYRDCSESERARTTDADHFEFYDIGVPMGEGAPGPYNFMWDEFEACPGLFEALDCPECRVADAIAQGTHADDDLILSYRHDNLAGDPVLPANRMRHRDVIYVPPAGTSLSPNDMRTELAILDAAYDDVLTPGYDEQFHITRASSYVALRADVFPADDLMHDDEVEGVWLTVDDSVFTVFDGAPSADRRAMTYEENWFPALDGQYADLVGAWFDVGGSYTALDPCGENVAPHSGDASTKRVLVMRSEVNPDNQTIRLYPDPVPDIIDVGAPANAVNTDVVWLSFVAFTHLDEEPTVRVAPRTDEAPDAAYIEAESLDMPVSTALGDTHSFVAEWDILQTWCDAYPTDGAMCGGYLDETPPETLLVTLRIEAHNSEGNHFWVERDVMVVRGEDRYSYSCEDSCGGQAPTWCWCDDLCARYGDCCPDATDQCDVTYSCLGRPWCS